MSFGHKVRAAREARERQEQIVATPETVPALAGLTADQLRECLELGATLMEIKELATAGFNYEAIASMASLLVANRSSGGDMGRMMAVLEQQAKNAEDQNERTRPRENPNYKTVSPTMKESGEQWARDLKCEVYLGPIHLNRTPLTKAEVDALNSLQPIANGSLTKTDGAVARVTVRGRQDAAGRLERLTIELPMRKEDNAHLTYPSLVSIATELASQAETVAA